MKATLRAASGAILISPVIGCAAANNEGASGGAGRHETEDIGAAVSPANIRHTKSVVPAISRMASGPTGHGRAAGV